MVVAAQPGGAPVQVSLRNTQVPAGPWHIELLGRRFVAWESNATYRPSALIEESRLWAFTAEPS